MVLKLAVNLFLGAEGGRMEANSTVCHTRCLAAGFKSFTPQYLAPHKSRRCRAMKVPRRLSANLFVMAVAATKVEEQQYVWTGSDEFDRLGDRVDAAPAQLPPIKLAKRVVLVRIVARFAAFPSPHGQMEHGSCGGSILVRLHCVKNTKLMDSCLSCNLEVVWHQEATLQRQQVWEGLAKRK
jgi:hypothetical protein